MPPGLHEHVSCTVTSCNEHPACDCIVKVLFQEILPLPGYQSMQPKANDFNRDFIWATHYRGEQDYHLKDDMLPVATPGYCLHSASSKNSQLCP
jgi:hypothetical protein